MIQLIVMTEEPSMEQCLKVILPKLLPATGAIIIPHEGKSDLEKSIPRKLRAFRKIKGLQYKFVIVRDQDSGDCKDVKTKLVSLCEGAGVSDALVRVVCHELESWFLGDLQAVERGLDKRNLAKKQNSKKYRDPDRLVKPSEELERLVTGYRKVEGARKISPYLNFDENKSSSFNTFISGIKAIATSPE